mgnify:CR=1 FL=1
MPLLYYTHSTHQTINILSEPLNEFKTCRNAYCFRIARFSLTHFYKLFYMYPSYISNKVINCSILNPNAPLCTCRYNKPDQDICVMAKTLEKIFLGKLQVNPSGVLFITASYAGVLLPTICKKNVRYGHYIIYTEMIEMNNIYPCN